jgi:DNA-binding CsgD family transcriptional regulator
MQGPRAGSPEPPDPVESGPPRSPDRPAEAAAHERGGLAAFGLDGDTEALYRTVLRHTGASLAVLSDRTGVPEASLPDRLRALADLRLVRANEGRVRAEPPDLALARLVNERDRALRLEEERLAAARASIPGFVAALDQGQGGEWEPVPVEAVEADDLVATMESLLQHSTGELLFMRPDQYSLPSGQAMDELVMEALRDGRRSRSLYPAAIADDVPERVLRRVTAGERVRVLPTVPARLAIFGEAGMVVPEHWDHPPGERLLVRQAGLVKGMTALFEALWDGAIPLPGLGRPEGTETEALVALLARGAKDEQVARVLGVSLRTVRRRIAALMDDLGAESRFQAGMQAVRRGLL